MMLRCAQKRAKGMGRSKAEVVATEYLSAQILIKLREAVVKEFEWRKRDEF